MGDSRIKHYVKHLGDTVKSWLDVSPEMRADYRRERVSEGYQRAFRHDALISVCIATYNRARLLTERALPSILRQTYTNLEIIVVGDACTDDTGARVASLRDERVRFVNRARRGEYPAHPRLRWMVAGTYPINEALDLARGDFITHLDDDDEHAPDRLERLLAFCVEHRLDLAWHPFHMEDASGGWNLRHCRRFEKGSVTTSSCLYHGWFRKLKWDPRAYRFREPGDWNRFRKFAYLGATMARYPEPLLKHYRERAQATA